VALNLLRGAVGFLTRLPVGHDDAAWEAFRRAPGAFPPVGYLVGALVALPLLAPVLAPVAAAGFLAAVYLLTGANHADGLADLGDAAATHGTADERVAAMKDTDVGVGAALSLAVVVAALGLAGLALARVAGGEPSAVGTVGGDSALARAPGGRPGLAVAGVVIAAEVGAKLGMAALACLGTARHDGLGARLTANNRPRDLLVPALAAAPAAVLTWPRPGAGAALAAALVTALVVQSWADARLGGVSGDVFGAANELARVVGLHVGVVALLA
jgi:adenosylcobinamide-GDP ribazoletransferase